MRLKGRRVLVTGGSGFLGANICLKLLSEGARVRAIDLFPCQRDGILGPFIDNIEMSICNIANEDEVRLAVKDVDTIVHLAFPMAVRQNSVENRLILENLAGLLNLTRAAQDHGALFVYISSIAVYGQDQYQPVDENHPLEPVLMYGAIKLAGENICRTLARSHGLQAVILRAADIYGPGNTRLSVPIRFLLQALHNKPVTVYGDGSDSRTYTFVEDFTEAVVLSMIKPEAIGEVFNMGGDECVSMRELAFAAKKAADSKSPIVYLDYPVSGRKLSIDNTKLKQKLGFCPEFGIGRGLSITCGWLRENPQKFQSTVDSWKS